MDNQVTVSHLRCEYKINPIGIDVSRPRLSWQLASSRRGVMQKAYQIWVAGSIEALVAGQDLLWDSGQVASAESTHRVYQGPRLRSGQRCYWRVRIRSEDGQLSAWSEPAFWEMGLLSPDDWQAAWITPDIEEDPASPGPSPLLRTTFTVDGPVQSARAYITGLGLYQAQLNGRPVGDELFTPGWTVYNQRLQYQTYDVGDLLVPGKNAVAAMLGDGWYRGFFVFQGSRNLYGERLALLLQIVIIYADGRTQLVCSDAGWRATTGPVRMAELYDGEVYDARLEQPGWSSPGFDDSTWAGVKIIDHPRDILVAPAGPPVRRIEEIRPVEILRTPAGETVFDMGQNMVGWVRLRVQGQAGTTVTLRHAEVLDRDGNFYTENLRGARQTLRYTLKGDGVEVYEPHFTFMGFRYVAVEGYPGEPTLDSLTGVVIHSDMAQTGHFECSNPFINQLQHNILWGQKGNFLDVPTDCPQRDERLGWTGDAQVFARTACFNMDVAAFFSKWLRDLAADQRPDGCVPFVAPDVFRLLGWESHCGSAGWGDAAAIVPWTLYLCYGDRRVLETQYDSMKGWVDYIWRQAGERLIWNTGMHFGDWLAPFKVEGWAPSPVTEKDLVATAFFAYSTSLLVEAARVLGRADDVATYLDLLFRIRQAFQNEFVTPSGRLACNTQTAYVLALEFDLLPEELRPEAARRLADLVRGNDDHLATGFLGTPYLCHVLSRHGYLDVAYDLLNQEECPSWLYQVKQGATTVWERWDSLKPAGEFQDPAMNSFNHYAYGAIGDWLYRVVAGIDVDPAAPGYKHVLIQPRPGGGLQQVRASLRTMYGQIVSAWELSGDGLRLNVTVPANTWATVRLPHAVLADVTESGKALDDVAGVRQAYQEGTTVVVELGSGRYAFTCSNCSGASHFGLP